MKSDLVLYIHDVSVIHAVELIGTNEEINKYSKYLEMIVQKI